MKQLTCQLCFKQFPAVQTVGGRRLTLYGRKNCLTCVPIGHRSLFYGGPRSYTQEELIKIVNQSTSIRQVLLALKLDETGAAYRSLQRAFKAWKISIIHFHGQGWSKGKIKGFKRPIDEYLSNEHPIQSDWLKKRLIKEGILLHQCSLCLLTQWNNQPIPIELDHINGKHEDNRLENLRILCPNCHAQTSTHAGKNVGKS